MSALSFLPFPCRHEPPPPPPLILPPREEALVYARTLDCGFNLTELNNITSFLGARGRSIDLLGSILGGIDCAALADDGYEDFNQEACEFIVATTVASVSEGSVCYQAMVDYVKANAERTSVEEVSYEMGFAPKVADMFSVAAQCGASDYGCNAIDECQAFESMCDNLVTALTTVIEITLDSVTKITITSTIAAIAVFFGVALSAKVLITASVIVAVVISLVTSFIGEQYCDGQRTQCRIKGYREGLTCEGMSCCPGENGFNCGSDCCCCPLFYQPNPATCECVSI